MPDFSCDQPVRARHRNGRFMSDRYVCHIVSTDPAMGLHLHPSVQERFVALELMGRVGYLPSIQQWVLETSK